MTLSKLIACITLSLIALSTAATTTVYKKVMPDGSISYSDEAQSGAEAVEVGPITTVPAITTQNKAQTRIQNPDIATSLGYSSLSITEPSHNSAFNSGSGTVNIAVAATPNLHQGHSFKFFLDRELLSEQSATQLTINNVSRGTHDLSVHIIDQAGKVLKTTTNTFTIHRPKVSQPRALN